MRSSHENVDTEYDWGHIMETHEIMYFVKRISYEFCFSVPRRQVRIRARNALCCRCASKSNARCLA